jgi:phosphatidate cytidylyltransferase
MNKIIQRLLVFFIGVPAIVALIFFLPFYNHLALNIIVVLFSAVGAVEFSNMLGKKQIFVPKAGAFILGALGPLSAVLTVSFNLGEFVISIILMTVTLCALSSIVFTKSANMDTVINRLAGCFSVMIYPGFFMYWLVKINSLGGGEWDTSGAVLLFLLIVFGNDAAAWLAGSLFGKNNKGIIPASPNKSIAGFIGGLIGSVIISVGAAFLFPFIFPLAPCCYPLVLYAVILGLTTAIAGNLGDLAESAVKRSCDFKDSGKLMFGRGGVLDSIDSIAMAAPVYYFVFILLYLFK